MQWDAQEFWVTADNLKVPVGDRPPIAVCAAYFELGGDPAVGRYISYKHSPTLEMPTTWNIVQVTDEHLIYVEAFKDESDWDSGSATANEDADRLIAWKGPVASIERAEILESSVMRYNPSANEIETRSRWRFIFRDGKQADLPVFAEVDGLKPTVLQQYEELATAVLAAANLA
jgi:hypothetical protein